MKRALNAFRFRQEFQLMSMIEAGRSEADLRTYLGGISSNALRITFPQVWRALQAREAAFASDKATLLQTMEEARVHLQVKKI